MSHILLTFLGRVPKTEQGYRTICYDFGDGRDEPPTPFFGWALQRRLKPKRLVILGTSGSMWDHLFEAVPAFEATGEVALELMEAVEEKRVTCEHLAPLTPLLNAQLDCEVHLELIPYARNNAEQIELLRIMASHVQPDDRVDLDVTHGFRHLPMLAILAALHLRSIRRATIGGIWYGAFDPDSGAAPAHNLIGLLQIADWLQALNTYDKDGDYGVFEHLIKPVSTEAAAALRQAALHEKTNHIGQARGALKKFRQGFANMPPDPLIELFADELQQRTAWVENQSLTERQYQLALHCLEHGDYLRAAILGFESLVTRLVQTAPDQLDPDNFDHRKMVKDKWDAEIRRQGRQRTETQQAYLDLRELRNTLAHGSRSDFGHIQAALASEASLRQVLSQAIELAHRGAMR